MQIASPTMIEIPEQPGIAQPGVADPVPGELDPPQQPGIEEPYPPPDEGDLPDPSLELSTGRLAFSTEMV